MKYNMYVTRDRVSGIYGKPFISHNDECAKRDFTVFCSLPQNYSVAADLDLFAVGVFDNETGEVVGEALKFIAYGVPNPEIKKACEEADRIFSEVNDNE